MNAEIEVRNVFSVKGRGAVAIGYLRQGTLRVGQQTRPLALGAGPHRVLTLAAVEAVHASDGGASALGLVFRERPSLEDLRAVLIPGTLLQFEDTTDAGTGTT
jgi:translation elongation factor EF-Tu-like GTPase